MIKLLVNLFLRASIGYFAWETVRRPNDPRFAGKAIPIRNLLIVGGFSLIFPARCFIWKKCSSYPFWPDNLFLSIFCLDMAGNSFNLYDRYYYFDLIPHFHGTGATAVVLKTALDLPALSAVGLATMANVALEGQEYYTDVLFGTHNVRGVSDTVNDLLAGLAGAICYSLAYTLFTRRRDERARTSASHSSSDDSSSSGASQARQVDTA